MNEIKLSENSDITIPLRNLIAILIATTVLVTGYFKVMERITHLERSTLLFESELKMNSEFRVKWPRGELGALPDDAEQNIRLTYLEKKLEQVENELMKTEEKLDANR